jgi:hypothetical protein
MHDAANGVLAHLGRDFVDLVVPVDLDCLASGVDEDFAMVTLSQVGADFFEQLRIDFVVEVVGHAREEVCTGHGSTLHDTDARRVAEGAVDPNIFVQAMNAQCVAVRLGPSVITGVPTHLCASSSG